MDGRVSLEDMLRRIMSGTLRDIRSVALRPLALAAAGASMFIGVAGASPSRPAASSHAAIAAPGAAQDAAPAPAATPAPADRPAVRAAPPGTAESTSGGGSKSSTSGSSSTSSTISFKKDGKAISIEENGSGITVTVDGKSVRASSVDELKQQHPDAYQLYVEKPGFAVGSAGGSARASGGQSSGSAKGGQPGNSEARSGRSRDRSVTVTENGKTVTISESASGISVTVGQRSVRARNADELKTKDAEAFRLYERHLSRPDTRREGADAEDLLPGNSGEGPSARDLMKEKLREMRNERPDDPRFQELIDRLLKETDR